MGAHRSWVVQSCGYTKHGQHAHAECSQGILICSVSHKVIKKYPCKPTIKEHSIDKTEMELKLGMAPFLLKSVQCQLSRT